MEGKKPICYWKDSVMNYKDPNPKFKWIQLINDTSIGKVTEPEKAGLISFKLSIHDKDTNGENEFQKCIAWKKPPPKRPIIKKVRGYIFQCRDLPAADSDGQSDPFIEIWDQDKVRLITTVIEDNLNPMFYETLEFYVECFSLEDMPPFILDVYDKDFVPLDPDDYIGRTVIPISEAAYSEDSVIPRPKWYPCHMKVGAPACGELLASFSICEDDYTFNIPFKHVDLKTIADF